MNDVEFTAEEESQRNMAAQVIQRSWRQHMAANASPESDMTHTDDDEEAKELSEEEKKAQLLDEYCNLLTQRDNAVQQNFSLQRTLAKLFAERRQGQEALDANQALPADVEAKYWNQIQKLKEERSDIERHGFEAAEEIQRSEQRHKDILEEANRYEENYLTTVISMAKEAVFPQNNRRIPLKTIQQFEEAEAKMHQLVRETRVQFLKHRNKAKKLAAELKDKEKLKDGMHLIDFEQLKIENTNLNEKIEERNEDLLKLRKKATNTIHILTHVKEKLEFVKAENVQFQKQVSQLEEQLSALRDRLTTAKRERDVYVNDNIKMREKMPMVGSEDLLLDYEVRKKEIENCRIRVVDLTNQHHELMQWINRHQPMLEQLQQSVL